MPYDELGAEQVAQAVTVDPTRTWYALSDLMDLNGDDVPESLYWGSGQFAGFYREVYDAAAFGPPRLLTAVNNGRGALTQARASSLRACAASAASNASTAARTRSKPAFGCRDSSM